MAVASLLRRPYFEALLEVLEEEGFILVEHHCRRGVFGLNVDDTMADTGASNPLADKLGDVDELDPFLGTKLHAVVTGLELGAFVLVGEYG